ncbi:MAG: glycosyltransferase, partial [Lachnospiraceae bacterium]|nr:glycosyltransferase [Lachnospiraceae bacterium]
MQKYETDNIIIVIPAYNPSAVLLELIAGLQEIGIQNIVCVNDGSTSSGTVFEKIESDFNTGGGYLLKHAVNFGKGIALKTAFNYILNYLPGKSIVITM